MGWIGLGWVGLGYVRLGYVRLGYVRLGKVNLHLFIRTLSYKDAGLYKIYWRIGSRFSAHIGVLGLKVGFAFITVLSPRGVRPTLI